MKMLRAAALAAILALCPLLGYAQGVLFTPPKVTAFDAGGLVCGGCQVFTYLDGTSTKANTYTTAALSVAHSNPIEADAYGKLPAIFLDPSLGEYKIVIAPADDTDPPTSPIETVDDYPSSDVTAALVGQAIYPRSAAEISAGVTPTNYAYPWLDVRRYGGDPTDGTATSDNAALAAAVNVAEINGGTVYLPEGTWNGCITIEAPTVSIDGAGSFASILEATNCDGITLDYTAGVGGVTIRDVNIQGVTGSTRSGITAPGTLDEADEIYRITVDNTLIRGFNVGIHLRAVRNVTLTNNWIQDVDRGLELIGSNLVSHISQNKIVHAAGAGGSGDVTGVTIDAFNFTAGSGLIVDEGIQFLSNYVYGFDTGIEIGASNTINIIAADIQAAVIGVDFSTASLGFNLTDSYFDMVGASVVAGIYGRALGSAPPSKVNIERNTLNGTSIPASGVAIKINDSGAGNQNYVTIDANYTTGDFDAGDIVVDNAGPTWITNNRLTSTTPTNSISVPNVVTGTVYIDRNLATKGINWVAAEAAAGEVVVGDNTHTATTRIVGSQQVPTVASAAALTLPLGSKDHEHFIISGTTNITSVVATGWVGRTVTLHFEDVLNFTDGSNLALASTMATTANDTITLACIGATWQEVARSVN